MPNPNIASLASMGGLSRSTKLSDTRRKEIASLAAKKRWEIYLIKKSHVCAPTHRCKNCGAYQSVHSKYSTCKDFQCKEI